MGDLADSFNVPAIGENRLVRAVGWITRQSSERAAMWKASDHPDAHFFSSVNPDYALGHGLVTLVPLTLAGLIGNLVRHAFGRIKTGAGAKK